MCLLGIFLAAFASAYNPMRSVFLCVKWVRAEVEASEVQCCMAYSVPYIGTDAYALSSVNMNSDSLGSCSKGTGG
eukprot:2075358-Alexandrium_andersonii.AAC.1